MSELPAWRVEFNTEACSICEVCAHICSTHALFIRKRGKIEQILFDSRLCDGCGGDLLCQEKCPEKAATVTAVPAKTIPGKPVVLIEGEMAVCRRCGAMFGTVRWLDAVMRKAKIDPKALSDICPTCRRRQLFDACLEKTGEIF